MSYIESIKKAPKSLARFLLIKTGNIFCQINVLIITFSITTKTTSMGKSSIA